MLTTKRLAVMALCAVLVCLLIVGTESKAKSKGKGKKESKPEKLSAKKLSKYIGCQTCMALSTSIFHQSSKIVTEKGSRKKMGEEPIMEMLEDICDPASERGEWTAKVDVVGTTGEFTFDIMDGYSACTNEECKAVVKTCEDIRSDIGEGEIAEKVYRGHYMNSPEIFAKAFCGKMSDYCPGKKYPGKRIDEKFESMDEAAHNARKTEKMMKDSGVGGKMMSRQSMLEEMEDMDLEEMGIDRAEFERQQALANGEPEREEAPKSTSPVDQFNDFARDASQYVSKGIDSVFSTVGGYLGFGGSSDAEHEF